MSNRNTAPVSVIVPTYNRAGLIGQSIDSLLQQTLPPQEIIVVVDGSTDNTMDVLGRYGDRIRVVQTENGGKSRALNLGLSLVSQPYTWIFDDDDIACPDALKRLHAALEADADAGIAYGTLDIFSGDWPSPVGPPLACYQSQDRSALYIMLMQSFFIWQGAMLVRTECYRAVGEFDPRFTRSQDYDMALRLLRRFRAIGVPHVIFHQRQHQGDRGPGHARLRAQNAEAVWAGFHRIIAERIHESHDLDEFVCATDRPLDDRSRVTALIQRAVVMACAGAWDKACADLEDAAAHSSAFPDFDLNHQELTALRGVFERSSRSRFGSFREARSFGAAIRRFDRRIAARISGNLLLPVTNRAKLMPLRPEMRQEARQLGYLLGGFLNLSILRAYLDARRSKDRLFRTQPLLPHQSS